MSKTPTHRNEFSIVLPCYNPPEGWEKTVVESILELEKTLNQKIYLTVVNDGSTSNNLETQIDFISSELKEFNFISYALNKGKGFALREGVKETKTDLIIYTDIDFPYTLKSIEAMIVELQNGSEVTLGHRGENYYKKTPWFRKIISKSLRLFLKTFLRLPTDDSQCGIKGFNSIGKQAFLDTNIDRFLFDLEFIKLASRRKMNCKTVDVTLKPNVVFSKVNLKILVTEALNFLKVLVRK